MSQPLVKDYARIPKEVREMADNFKFDAIFPSADNIPSGCEFISCDEMIHIESNDSDHFSKEVLQSVIFQTDLNKRLDMDDFVTYMSFFLNESGKHEHADATTLNSPSYCAVPRNSPVSTTYLFMFSRTITNGDGILGFFGLSQTTRIFSFTCYRIKTKQDMEKVSC